MQYLPTFGFKFMVNVGKYTIHGYDSDMIYLRMFSFSEIILEGVFFRTNRGVIVGVPDEGLGLAKWLPVGYVDANSPVKDVILWVVPPPRIPVTTRNITFLGIGDPYKLSFPLLLGGGTTQVILYYNWGDFT